MTATSDDVAMAAGPRVLLLFAPEDESLAGGLAPSLEREGVSASLQVIPLQGVDPNQFGETFRGFEAVGILVGRAGLPSWLLSVVASLQEAVRFGVIWLPTNVDDTMLSWPPDVRSAAAFDLAKAGQDEREIVDLAAFLRSITSATGSETFEQNASEFVQSAPNAPEFAEQPEVQSEAQSAPIPQQDTPPSVSPAEAFKRMTPGAKRALAEAERLARLGPDGRLHMEHLIAGLYGWTNGRTRSALTEAGVTSTRLAEILGLPETELAPVATGTIQPIEHLPALSKHVERAFAEAAGAPTVLPDTQISIRARHLFYGALKVPDCSPVQQLLETPGLHVEDVLRDTVTPAPNIADDETTSPVVEPPPEESASPPAGAPGPGRPVAGFRSDEASGNDLLNLDDEIDALATVIASDSVEPPLAMGLFGDWGTGKTFFMNMLEQRIDQIAAAELEAKREKPFYCRHVVQLRFNAWHYIEQDLWASLASAIFDGLDRWITATSTPADADEADESKRARLLTEQARMRDDLETAERQGDESREAIESIDASLGKLDDQYDELVKKVPKTEIVKAVVRIAADQPEIRREAENAQKAIREQVVDVAGKTNTDAKALNDAVSKGTIEGIRTAATGWWDLRRGWRLWLPLTVAILIAIALVVAVASRVDLDPAMRAISSAISIAVGFVIVYAGYLAYPAARVVGLIRQARSESDRLIENARASQRANLQAARKKAEERAVQAELNAAAARKELDKLRVDLLDTEPSREMATFIKRRQSSEDYRSRLGVVAKARDDFEELTKLLAKQSEGSPRLAEEASKDGTAAELFTPIDRIVLYIDDLDRCKEADVVNVLQAVHLLLAFRLFVVVVAVDPRWLLHSLRVSSRVLAAADVDTKEPEDEFGWEATPLNYLEKIFQIPYALRPMGKTGFEALVANLVPSVASSTSGSTAAGVSSDATAAAGEVPTVSDAGNGHELADATTLEAAQAPVDAIPPSRSPLVRVLPESPTPEPQPAGVDTAPIHRATAEPPSLTGPTLPRPVDMSPIALDITQNERACMYELHELIATPRSAKRFVNVYRLFKASSPASERVQLSDPLRYRPILVLLAVLTGYPAEATDILRSLIEREPVGRWLEFVVRLKEPRELTQLVQAKESRSGETEYAPQGKLEPDKVNAAERWAALQNKLIHIDAALGPIDASLFRPWARRVARYGFESSRVLVTEETLREPVLTG